MTNVSPNANQVLYVSSFQQLVSTPFHDTINAICWSRTLTGNFAEIVAKAASKENITVLGPEELAALELTEKGQLARTILLEDFHLLTAHGASPSINIIRQYDRDDDNSFFPTDVYSYHADRSPVPTDTFLCTYYGEPSDILPNAQAIQKVLVPAIREQVKKLYNGAEKDFESFLKEHFFDLHYMAAPGASPISLGTGNLWRLAVDHPGSKVLPCVHRAPKEKEGESRLLLIC
ncbi:MAG: hypothetical protein QM791_21715 [Ferruginibacter sp.]